MLVVYKCILIMVSLCKNFVTLELKGMYPFQTLFKREWLKSWPWLGRRGLRLLKRLLVELGFQVVKAVSLPFPALPLIKVIYFSKAM